MDHPFGRSRSKPWKCVQMQPATGVDGVSCSGDVFASLMAGGKPQTRDPDDPACTQGYCFLHDIIGCELEPNGEAARIGRQQPVTHHE